MPIKISHQTCKKTIRTFAMLDNCSQKLSLNLKTLTGEKSEETLMVDNLKVPGLNKMNGWISLPKIYSKKKHFQLKKKRLQPQRRYQNGSI